MTADLALRIKLAAERVRRERNAPSLRDSGPYVRGFKAAAQVLGIAPRTLHLWVRDQYDGIDTLIVRRTARQALFDRERLMEWDKAHSIGPRDDVPVSKFQRLPPNAARRRPGATHEILNLVAQVERPLTIAQMQLSMGLQFEAPELSAALLRLCRRQVLGRQLVASESGSGRRHVWGYVRGPQFCVRGLCDPSHDDAQALEGV